MASTIVPKQQSFFQRNTALVLGVAVALAFIAVVLGILLYTAREQQKEILGRLDLPPVNGAKAPPPGREDKMSVRSEKQMEIMLKETPHVLGGWMTKLKYQKNEYPVIYSWSGHPIIDETLRAFESEQAQGRGFSSDQLDVSTSRGSTIRNSEEARQGLIKCGAVGDTRLLEIYPPLVKKARGVCRATLPPFDDNNNLAIIVVTDVEGTDNTPEMQAIRRTLLQLQIDIFNRDYQGRETWARATTP